MSEWPLILTYAPADRRPALEALWMLDGALGSILRSTREPLVGQMRLTWWHDALTGLDSRPAPAEPILAALKSSVLPKGVTGATLAEMASGWEMLLAQPLGEAELVAHAGARGGGLFAAAAAVLGEEAPMVAGAGEGWALADVARNLSDRALADRAEALAGERLAAALAPRWPGALRMLGAVAWSARMDLARPARPAGHPARAARLLRFRLTGR